MFNDLAQEHKLWWLIAFMLLLAATFLHVKDRRTAALILLTLAAFILRLSAIFLDPFLNMWDEVFHAVTARNMMENPLTPMLHREPAMPITTHWPHQHIWLHKPPVFLWLMALSMKIFGTEIWAARLPSAVLTTLLVPITWRMGKLLSSERTGFVAAVLIAFSYLLIELTAGAINTDHNDAIFIVFVGGSLWALLEYLRNLEWRWAGAVGLFCAAAILTKWYIGLLAFLPWGIILIQRKFEQRMLAHFVLAFFITAVIVGAWLAYIWQRFPVEASFESNDNWLRFIIPFEGHGGPWTFHFEVIRDLVPPFTWWLILPAFSFLLFQVKQNTQRVVLISAFVSVHVFFGFAQTKMICYTMVLLPIYMIAVARIFSWISSRSKQNHSKWVYGSVLPILAIFCFSPEQVLKKHTLHDPPSAGEEWRMQQLETIPELHKLKDRLDPASSVVFNIPSLHFLQFMFASGVQSWDKMPTPEIVERLIEKGYSVYALQDGRELSDFPEGVIVITDEEVSIPRRVRH